MKTAKQLKAEYDAYHTSLRNVELPRPADKLSAEIQGIYAVYWPDDDTFFIDCGEDSFDVKRARALGQWLVAVTEEE